MIGPLSPVYRWENWGCEKLSNSPSLCSLWSEEAKNGDQVCLTSESSLFITKLHRSNFARGVFLRMRVQILIKWTHGEGLPLHLDSQIPRSPLAASHPMEGMCLCGSHISSTPCSERIMFTTSEIKLIRKAFAFLSIVSALIGSSKSEHRRERRLGMGCSDWPGGVTCFLLQLWSHHPWMMWTEGRRKVVVLLRTIRLLWPEEGERDADQAKPVMLAILIKPSCLPLLGSESYRRESDLRKEWKIRGKSRRILLEGFSQRWKYRVREEPKRFPFNSSRERQNTNLAVLTLLSHTA